MLDLKLLVAELEGILLIFLVSMNKMYDMIFRFSYSCDLRYLSKIMFGLQTEKGPNVFVTLN